MKRMSNVKSLRELGVEFGMPNASKREIAMEVISRGGLFRCRPLNDRSENLYVAV